MWNWLFGIFGIAYGILTLCIHERISFLAWTSAALGAFFTLVGLMLSDATKKAQLAVQRCATEALDTARVTQFLRETTSAEVTDGVFSYLTDLIHGRLREISERSVELMREELEEISTRQLSLVSHRAHSTYHATHLVNSKVRLDMWGKPGDYEWMTRYIRPQKELLEKGGAIVRIFVFTENYLKDHADDVERLLRQHQTLFTPQDPNKNWNVKTLAAMAGKEDSQDVTILNDSEVFLWHVSGDDGAAIRGGRYATKGKASDQGKALFQRFHDLAVEPKEFVRTKLRKGRGP